MSHDPSPPHIIGPVAQPTPVPRSGTAPIGGRQSHSGLIDGAASKTAKVPFSRSRAPAHKGQLILTAEREPLLLTVLR
jgi:hypothetical protein